MKIFIYCNSIYLKQKRFTLQIVVFCLENGILLNLLNEALLGRGKANEVHSLQNSLVVI